MKISVKSRKPRYYHNMILSYNFLVDSVMVIKNVPADHVPIICKAIGVWKIKQI